MWANTLNQMSMARPRNIERSSSPNMQSFGTPCESTTTYEHQADAEKPKYMRRVGCGNTLASSGKAANSQLCRRSAMNGTWGTPYCGDLCHCLVEDCTLTEDFRELQLRGSGYGRGDQCTPPIDTL